MAARALYICLLFASPASVCCGRCVTHLHQDGHPVFRLVPGSPVTHQQAEDLCSHVAHRGLLYFIDELGDREKDTCPGNALVPLAATKGDFGRPVFVQLDETAEFLLTLKDGADDPVPDYDGYPEFGAVNLTTGRWHYTNYYHEFDCVLCQRDGIKLQPPERFANNAITEKYTTLAYFQVNVTSTKSRASDDVAEGEVRAVRAALSTLLQPMWYIPVVPLFHHSRLDGDQLRLEFRVFGQVLKAVADSSETTTLLDEYVVTLRMANVCPLDQTTDADGVVMVWPSAQATDFGVLGAGTGLMASVNVGDVEEDPNLVKPNQNHRLKVSSEGRYKSNNRIPPQIGAVEKLISSFQSPRNESDLIPRRDCIFNKGSYTAAWSEVTYWRPSWEPCSDEDEYYNEEIYKEVLGEEVINRRIHQLQRYAAAPINASTLKEVTSIINRQVDLFNTVGEMMTRDLVNITSNLLLDDGEDACLAQATRAYVLVSALTGKEPVVGLTVEFLDGSDAGNINISLDRTQMAEPRPNQQFSLSVSDGLVVDHKRMALFVFWMEIPVQTYGQVGAFEHRRTQYIEVTVALTLKSGQKDGVLAYGRYSDFFVDVTFKPHSDQVQAAVTVMTCSGWNREAGRWATAGCHTLKANRGSLTVCRCSAKYFALDAGVPGVATAKLALNKEYSPLWTAPPFIGFIKDSTALIATTLIECLLSAMGLGSILCTAIIFKDWRKNVGHQILLQMVLALTGNLVLGFTTNFVHLDTESVGCLVLGVLRHYSFLAMFLWMLVLSGLQMKRLTTVAGAKAVNHLVLKASLFAWGVPMIPIAILLAWNARFYLTDRFDRGYCYPEGLVFELTVQAPAGIILLVNLITFLGILAHIFGCCGVEITRHSKNKRQEQLNKLKTTLFMFFLFGFTWVFHYLSEERVISSDFLFEYLFLMTATTHILVLALFFIVLQDNTRQAWVIFFKKFTPGDGNAGPTPSKNGTRRQALGQSQPAKRRLARAEKPKVAIVVV